MQIIDIIKNLVNLLTTFDIRIIVITFVLLGLAAIDTTVAIASFSKKSILIIINGLLLSVALSFLIDSFLFQAINTETAIISSVIIISAIIGIDTFFLIAKRKVLFPNMIIPKIKWNKAFTSSFITTNVLTILVLVVISIITLTTKPHAYKSTPETWQYMASTDQTIEIFFNIPVQKDTLIENISPNVKGNWKYADEVLNTNYYRKLTFVPTESFPADSKVVIYLSGLKQMLPGGEVNEEPVEFFTTQIPKVVSTLPANDATQISTSSSIVVNLDKPGGDFILWEVQTEPQIKYSIQDTKSSSIKIVPDEKLQQDTAYTIHIFQTPVIYKTDSKEVISKGTSTKVTDLSFRTVTTPLLKAYSPQGDAANPESVIRVEFDDNMKRGSVENGFSITPKIEGSMSWENDKTFIFTPDSPLEKDTKYEYTFAKGISNSYGGLTAEQVKVSFKTVGKVAVTEVFPFPDQTSVEINGTNITVKFNQEVDHQSAQEHFSVNPGVPNADFVWNDNTMTYNTGGKLTYNTRYTFSIAKGVKSLYGVDSDQDFNYAFITKDNVVMLRVPQYYQTYTSFVCNVVATKMVLGYYGMYRDEYGITDSIGHGNDPNQNWVNYYGTHWDPIANYIKSQGRGATAYRGMTVAQLTSELDQGHPTIIWWYNGRSQPAMQPIYFDNGTVGYKGMHSSVVIGYVGYPGNPRYLIINDPWLGPGLWYQTDDFIAQWQTFGYTGVVVY